MLRGFYRNPCPGVKLNYPSFSDLSKKVINKMYANEFIVDNIKIDLTVLKPIV